MNRKHYGKTRDGRAVEQFELQNRNGVIIRCISYGACLTDILLPSASGHEDVILGFDDLAGYEADNSSQGAFIGRYANRIRGAEFAIGGRPYQLMKNDGGNYLHGKLQTHVFSAETASDNGVVFKTTAPAGEEGFPGELKVTVAYSLDDDNRLTMDYTAQTDADTYINLTNHAYFDLSNGADETIENHLLRIESDRFLETTEDLIPTGRIIEAAGTPFDFTHQKTIGRDIGADDPNIKKGRGYDHCFILSQGGKGELALAAEACAPSGERSLRVFTTQPAIQLYTGNFLDGTLKGKGRVFTHRSAFCLETQHYPDSPHHPEFPSTLLKPGEEFHETTVLQFGF
ncbi:MAG: galactose mutarotase [Synergistaceae bacterium]|jgi:aldose 1-epimerase|nr:galactose mutarotase [Synergistaceae bacterium]